MARSWTTDAPSPDDAAAQYAIQERLRMARALREQSMQGASLENVGGQLVGNPIARALTSGLQGFSAGRQEKRALGDASALAGQQRERLAAALAGAGGQKTPDDMIAFGTKLLADPATAEVGQFYVQAGQRSKERAEEEAAKDAQFRRGQTAAQARAEAALKAQDERARLAREAAAENARLAREAAAAREAAKGAQGPDPFSTTINTLYGQLPFNTRDQTITIPGVGPVPFKDFYTTMDAHPEIANRIGLRKPGDDPGRQGDITYDKTRRKLEAEAITKREMQEAGVDEILGQARRLLSGNEPGAKLPTGSGFGAMVDSAAGFVGYSPDGAKEADRLSTLGATLTAKVPRMEGPQSNADRDYYERQAGMVGNPKIPRERRLAALLEVERIWNTPIGVKGRGGTDYEVPDSPAGAPEGAAPPAAAPPSAPPRRIKLDAQGNEVP